MFQSHATYRIVDGTRIRGTSLLAFIHNHHYYITPIMVYRDGMINCWGLVDMAGFKRRVEEGWVVTCVPEGARVGIAGSGTFFTATNVTTDVEPQEFIRQVADMIRELNDVPTTSEICRAALDAYNADPSPSRKEALRLAYEDVPRHMRRYLGGTDDQDSEILAIIER